MANHDLHDVARTFAAFAGAKALGQQAHETKRLADIEEKRANIESRNLEKQTKAIEESAKAQQEAARRSARAAETEANIAQERYTREQDLAAAKATLVTFSGAMSIDESTVSALDGKTLWDLLYIQHRYQSQRDDLIATLRGDSNLSEIEDAFERIETIDRESAQLNKFPIIISAKRVIETVGKCIVSEASVKEAAARLQRCDTGLTKTKAELSVRESEVELPLPSRSEYIAARNETHLRPLDVALSQKLKWQVLGFPLLASSLVILGSVGFLYSLPTFAISGYSLARGIKSATSAVEQIKTSISKEILQYEESVKLRERLLTRTKQLRERLEKLRKQRPELEEQGLAARNVLLTSQEQLAKIVDEMKSSGVMSSSALEELLNELGASQFSQGVA